MNTAELVLRDASDERGHHASTARRSNPEILGVINGLEIEAFSDISPLEDDWLDLERRHLPSIYQHFRWVRTAIETIDKNGRPFVVTGRIGSKLCFILPMVIEPGFVKVLRWAGGSHANICGGIFTPQAAELLDKETLRALFRLIGKAVGGFAMLQLDNQLSQCGDLDNPILKLPYSTAINPMFKMDLSEGFDAMLEAGNAKRKRKSFRRQVRIAEDNGGFELFIPRSETDIREAVREFRELKSIRFKELGIADVFAPEEAGAFLERLALLPPRDGIRPLEFAVLKIGGKTRAMYAGAFLQNYYQAAVNAISSDELTNISPGEMLLYLFVEHMAGNGIVALDLGVGEERYKRSWCQFQDKLFNTILPLNLQSVPVAVGMKSAKMVKRYLRNNPKVWQLLKKFRKAMAPKAAGKA